MTTLKAISLKVKGGKLFYHDKPVFPRNSSRIPLILQEFHTLPREVMWGCFAHSKELQQFSIGRV